MCFDANGRKGPNKNSNCEGIKAKAVTGGTASVPTWHEDYMTRCNNKKNRVIKDRFMLLLIDNNAEPYDDAARWIMAH